MAESNYRWMRTAAQVWSIPFLILVSTGLGLGLGMWLDGKFGTKPWLAAVLTLLGLAAGIVEAAKILIQVTRDE